MQHEMKQSMIDLLKIWHSIGLCLRRKSQQAEREYEKVKHQLENLEESVRDRCKKEFTGQQTQIFYRNTLKKT